MRTQRILWRWAERDFGFRFRQGRGKQAADFYQAGRPGEFYNVPGAQRKLSKARLEELAAQGKVPTAPIAVANPWTNYADPDLQVITSPSRELCLNWAGCLSLEEVNARETNGVNRVKEFVADLATREEAVPITLDLIRQIHREMFSEIYPWSGEWRTVSLHKGEGATKWPLPRYGWEPVFVEFQRDVLALTPFISDDAEAVCKFAAKFMGEYLAIHPFREGNGRSAFVVSDLIMLQNGLVPLDAFNRQRDRDRYFAACEEARVNGNHQPLADLVVEWEAEAQQNFERRMSEEN
jgi:cell filamentation protein